MMKVQKLIVFFIPILIYGCLDNNNNKQVNKYDTLTVNDLDTDSLKIKDTSHVLNDEAVDTLQKQKFYDNGNGMTMVVINDDTLILLDKYDNFSVTEDFYKHYIGKAYSKKIFDLCFTSNLRKLDSLILVYEDSSEMNR